MNAHRPSTTTPGCVLCDQSFFSLPAPPCSPAPCTLARSRHLCALDLRMLQIYAAVQPTEHGYIAVLSVPGETLPPGFIPKLHWCVCLCVSPFLLPTTTL